VRCGATAASGGGSLGSLGSAGHSRRAARRSTHARQKYASTRRKLPRRVSEHTRILRACWGPAAARYAAPRKRGAGARAHASVIGGGSVSAQQMDAEQAQMKQARPLAKKAL